MGTELDRNTIDPRDRVKSSTSQRIRVALVATSIAIALTLFAASSGSADEWSVQIGAFRAAPAGYTTAAEEVGPLSRTQNAAGITRFQIGRYDSRDAATTALVALVGAGYADAFVVQKGAGSQVAIAAPANSTASTSPTTTSIARRASGTTDALTALAGVPDSIRSQVVVLDGAYYVKDGEQFTPLDEAMRALR